MEVVLKSQSYSFSKIISKKKSLTDWYPSGFLNIVVYAYSVISTTSRSKIRSLPARG